MNIRDIARLANVTPGTVSKILNNYSDISEATRQRVLKVIEENQYVPAKMTKGGSGAPKIGIVVEGVFNEVVARLEDRLTTRLHNADYALFTFHDNYFVQNKNEKFAELITFIDSNKVNGLIYIGGNFESLTDKQFEELPCPVIFVNTALPMALGESSYSSIQVNNFEAAYSEMLYLIEKGHTNICIVTSSLDDTSIYGQRLKGYKAALSESNIPFDPDMVVASNYNSPTAATVLEKYLQTHPDTTAICCACDCVIPGVIRAMNMTGHFPGDDIDLISFDGLPSMQATYPTVTSFAIPIDELASCAYELILGLISNKRRHQHITFQAKLEKGESC